MPGDGLQMCEAGGCERLSAWKLVGYPGFSDYMASSTDCFAIRKFSSVHVRVLLSLQNRVSLLEIELKRIDNHGKELPHGQGGCNSLQLDEDTPRSRVMLKLEQALAAYDDMLLHFLQLQDRPLSSPQQKLNIRNWLENYPNVIVEPEQDFIQSKHDNDLIAISVRDRTALGSFLYRTGIAEVTERWLPKGLRSKEVATAYFSQNSWAAIGRFYLTSTTLLMLLMPLWFTPIAKTLASRLALVSAFTFATSVIVTLCTTLSTVSRTAAVACYFTILVLVTGLMPIQGSHVAVVDSASSTSQSSPQATTTTVYETQTATSLAQDTNSHSDVHREYLGPQIAVVAAAIFICVMAVAVAMLQVMRLRRHSARPDIVCPS